MNDSVCVIQMLIIVLERKLSGKRSCDFVLYTGYDFFFFLMLYSTCQNRQWDTKFEINPSFQFLKALQIAVTSFPRPLFQSFFQMNFSWNMFNNHWRKDTEMPNQCLWYMIIWLTSTKLEKEYRSVYSISSIYSDNFIPSKRNGITTS